jgi:predicted transcriptional regulator
VTPRSELPDLELSCMKILWEAGDLTVREVRERLQPRRPLAYTTVMTVLDRLARKGVVTRRKVGRAHLYHAEFTRGEARGRAVRRLLDFYFDGSADALRAFLSGTPAVRRTAAAAGRGSAAAEPAGRLDESLL